MKRFLSLMLILALLCGTAALPGYAETLTDNDAPTEEAATEQTGDSSDDSFEAEAASTDEAAEAATPDETPAAPEAEAEQESDAEKNDQPAMSAEPETESEPASTAEAIHAVEDALEEAPEATAAPEDVTETPAAPEQEEGTAEPETDAEAAEQPETAQVADAPAQEPEAAAEEASEAPEIQTETAEMTETTAEEPAPELENQDVTETSESESEPPVTSEEPASQTPSVSEPEPEETAAVDIFHTGLARLSAGDVYADAPCKAAAGQVTKEAVVFVTERISGDGRLDRKDVVRIALNAEGEIRSFYVRAGRLAYLTEDENQRYSAGQHANAAEYGGVKLEQASFRAYTGETESTEVSGQGNEQASGQPAAAEGTAATEAPASEAPTGAPAHTGTPEPIVFEEIQTTTAVNPAQAASPTVKVPAVTASPSLSIKANTTVDYDYVTKGSLTIRWNAANGNGVYTVKAILLNSAPNYAAAATNVVATLVNEKETTKTSFTLTAADMQRGKYLKVWIMAQDVHYKDNKGTKAISFGIHFMPKAQVSVSVSTTPGIAVQPDTLTDYDCTARGDLTLKWSAAHGNGKYTVKALLLNNKPNFTSAATGIVKTLLSQTDGTNTTLKITAADMKAAKYMKILIRAQDVHYSQNGRAASIQFALQLKPDARVTVSVSTSPALPLQPRTITNYDQVANGALTLRWASQNGNGRYHVKAVMANAAPKFGAATGSVVKTVVSLTNTEQTSVTIPVSDLSLGKYMKVVVTAQDVDYARNGATASVEYGIMFKPTAKVKAPVVSSTPKLSLAANTIVDYRVGDGDLTIKWTASGSNQKYAYTIAIAKNEPVFGKATTGVVKRLTADNTAATSLKIAASDLALGNYLKILVTAQDENYLQNAKKASVEVGVRLLPVFTIEAISSSTARIICYNGAAADVLIPSTLNGYKIVEIGAEAFRGNGLKKVTIPNTVTVIGASAFENCASLTTVILSDNVNDIDESAFDNCASLVTMLVRN